MITIVAPLIILIAGGLAFSDGTRNPFVSATLGMLLLLVVAVALHGEMFRLRPAVGHLTRFYLAMSFGGMLGGVFCAFVAPLVFDWAYEHPILILLAALLVPQYPLVPWPKRCTLLLGVAIPVAAIVLSYPERARLSRRHPEARRCSAASRSRCSRWPASAGASPSWSRSPP